MYSIHCIPGAVCTLLSSTTGEEKEESSQKGLYKFRQWCTYAAERAVAVVERGTVKLEVVNRGNEAERRRRRRKEIGAFSPPPPNLRSLGFQTPHFRNKVIRDTENVNHQTRPRYRQILRNGSLIQSLYL